MQIASPGIMLLAAALASPTLISAAKGQTSIGDAATWFLICVVVAAIMMAGLRSLTRDYGASLTSRLRRRDDEPAMEGDPPVKPTS